MAGKSMCCAVLSLLALSGATPSWATEADMVWKVDLEADGSTTDVEPGEWVVGPVRAQVVQDRDFRGAYRGLIGIGLAQAVADAGSAHAQAAGQDKTPPPLPGDLLAVNARTGEPGNAECLVEVSHPIKWSGLLSAEVRLVGGQVQADAFGFASTSFRLSLPYIADPLVTIELRDTPFGESVDVEVSTDPAALFRDIFGNTMTPAEVEAHVEAILTGVFDEGVIGRMLFSVSYDLPDPLPTEPPASVDMKAAALVIQQPIFVDDALGDDSNPGTFDQPLKTIGAAVGQAMPNDTVVFGPGTYGANIATSSPVHLVGSEWLMSGDNSTTFVEASVFDQPVLDLSAGSWTAGFNVRYGTHGLRTSGETWVSDMGISSNSQVGENGGGIDYVSDTCANGDALAVIKDSTIEFNSSSFDLATGSGGCGGGLSATLDADPACGNAILELVGNDFRDNVVAGMAGVPGLGGGSCINLAALPGALSRAEVHNNVFFRNSVGTWAPGAGGNVFVGSDAGGANTLNFGGNGVLLGQAEQAAGMLVAASLTASALFTANIVNNNASGNSAVLDTGAYGLAVEAMNLTGGLNLNFSGNNAVSNYADSDAGAHIKVELDATPPELVDLMIDRNQLKLNYSNTESANLKVDVSGNSDDGAGGGIPTGAEITIRNNLVRGDRFNHIGPGMIFTGTATGETVFNTSLLFNTIVEHTSDYGVAANWTALADTLGNQGGYTLNSVGNIYADNGTGFGGTVPSTPNSSLVHSTNLWWGSTFNVDPGEPDPVGQDGNVEADPLFDSDFSPGPGSPAIDVADPAMTAVSHDFHGEERPFDGNGDGAAMNDLGCIEARVCIDQDADGHGAGLTGPACSARANDCNDADSTTWSVGGDVQIVMSKDPSTGNTGIEVTSTAPGSTSPSYFVEHSTAADVWFLNGALTPNCENVDQSSTYLYFPVIPAENETLFIQVGESSSCGRGPLGPNREVSGCYP